MGPWEGPSHPVPLSPHLRSLTGWATNHDHLCRNCPGEYHYVRQSQGGVGIFNFKSLAAPIVFGHPWLPLHGSHINWADNSVSLLLCSLSCVCPVSCLFFFSVAGGGDQPMPSSCHVPQSATSRSRAASLLPHCAYDCAMINFLPGLSPCLLLNGRPWRNIWYCSENMNIVLITPDPAQQFVVEVDVSEESEKFFLKYPLLMISYTPVLITHTICLLESKIRTS